MRRCAVTMVGAVLAASAPAAASAATPSSAGAAEDLTTLVAPLSGSLGAGFPMVAGGVPFGMAEAGPDTALPGAADQVNYCGYAYQDTTIRGFSLTHFDGAGIHIGGDLPFMPTAGAVTTADPTRFASPFSHADETARPGYYAVTLGSGIRAEISGTTHAAVERFSFPAVGQANVLLDASDSIGGSHPAAVRVADNHTLQGLITSTADSSGYTLYFTARFDVPFRAWGTWSGAALSPASRAASGPHTGAWVTLDTSARRVATMRVGISYVDAAGAARNLDTEIPAARSLDAVATAAHDQWNARLHDIEVGGGDPGARATFYTNLYRSLLMPPRFDDSDGRYLGFDGVVRSVPAGHHQYTDLSLWDTYRSQTPLFALVEPSVARDVGLSLLADYDQNGQVIPRWTYANRDYGIMGGDSGTASLADLTARGLFDDATSRRAYAALLHQATTTPPVWPRAHMDADLQHGFVPHDVDGNGAALTLEYAIDDAAVLAVARRWGTAADVTMLAARAGHWRNLVDPKTRFLRPRNSDGTWATPTSRGPVATWNPNLQDGYQEGTAWQYQWFAPQDVAGLGAAIGGVPATRSRLDTFFSAALNQPLVPGVPLVQQQASLFGIYYAGDQYTPANETDLWAPWYYDWLGQPSKTQRIVRAEMSVYSSRPNGMPGNDDAGEMSAWYVLAAIGMYSVAPGGGVWALNSPAFASVVVHPEGGTTAFSIVAPGASSSAPYIDAASLGGATLVRPWLRWGELHGGVTLRISLGATASSWGAGSPPPDLAPSA